MAVSKGVQHYRSHLESNPVTHTQIVDTQSLHPPFDQNDEERGLCRDAIPFSPRDAEIGQIHARLTRKD
jgi:hypothetical protein